MMKGLSARAAFFFDVFRIYFINTNRTGLLSLPTYNYACYVRRFVFYHYRHYRGRFCS